ncbi:MAG: M48 family metalloprotease [Dehalococcoidia bacterium]|nr:M48 family metalloprotease [Dehalococcoidia bacterium]
MWLQARMYLLIALFFGILYGVITGLGAWMGAGSAITYLIIGFGFLLIQYLISPAIVGWSMRIKWVSEKEAPELHQMVAELAERAGLPKPRVGISQLSIPNAFAFGRSQRDGRVCVTQGIMKLLNREELKAVIGHELSQIDLDMSGTIDYDELMTLRQKDVKLSKSQKLMEIFTTHPNMLKRIKHLSTLAV